MLQGRKNLLLFSQNVDKSSVKQRVNENFNTFC